MDYFKPSAELIGIAPSNEDDMLRLIEIAGRTCYRSEEKITEETYTKFFKHILSNKHMSVLEHSNICFAFPIIVMDDVARLFLYTLNDFGRSSFFKIVEHDDELFIAANLRAWIEFFVFLIMRDRIDSFSTVFTFFTRCYPKVTAMFVHLFKDDPNYDTINTLETGKSTNIRLVDEKEQLQILIDTGAAVSLPVFIARLITNRGISHEVVRNRTLGISQESTRYVNYNKRVGINFSDLRDEFKGSETFPLDGEITEDMKYTINVFLNSTEEIYNNLTTESNGSILMRPEFARDLLPNALRTEMVISGRLDMGVIYNGFDLSSGLAHFIRQRSGSGAHPNIQILAKSLNRQMMDEFKIGLGF